MGSGPVDAKRTRTFAALVLMRRTSRSAGSSGRRTSARPRRPARRRAIRGSSRRRRPPGICIDVGRVIQFEMRTVAGCANCASRSARGRPRTRRIRLARQGQRQHVQRVFIGVTTTGVGCGERARRDDDLDEPLRVRRGPACGADHRDVWVSARVTAVIAPEESRASPSRAGRRVAVDRQRARAGDRQALLVRRRARSGSLVGELRRPGARGSCPSPAIVIATCRSGSAVGWSSRARPRR